MTVAARAAILESPGAPFVATDVEIGDPGTDEVLVRLVAAGLCHTDLGVQVGGIPLPLPGIAGHEGAGVIEAIGPGVNEFAIGDHVLMSFTSCGVCPNCAAGHPAYCATWLPRNLMGGVRGADSAAVTRDGQEIGAHFFGQSSFSSHAVVDRRSLVKVDPDADLTVLAPLGCGVLTGFGSVWGVLDPQPDDSVAVYGTGAVGLAGIMAAAMREPALLIAIDVVDERLQLARDLGATHTINAKLDDVAARLAEITDGVGVQLSFDTTGSPTVARGALDAAAGRGTVLVCGAPPPGTEIPVDIQGVLMGKQLRGVTMGDAIAHDLIPQLVQLHSEGRLPLERLQKQYDIEHVQQAAEDMHRGVTVKPVIVF